MTINRFLDRTRDIRISAAKHGPSPNREYSYESTFLLRGLKELHIEFTEACCRALSLCRRAFTWSVVAGVAAAGSMPKRIS
jgi:hypothetical protein